MTAKERARIYRKSFKHLFSRDIITNRFSCIAISYVNRKATGEHISVSDVPKQFYELSLFNPINKAKGGGWWEMEDKESRAIALLLCEQMALDENKKSA